MTFRPRPLAAALALALADAAAAEEPHAACHPAAGSGEAAPVRAASPSAATVRLEEVALLDQDGAPRRFRSEAVGDRIVVMDFVFTTCTTVCPVLSAKMARVQERLGERLGREVVLVSVTVDPVRDTPARLLAYARRHGARPGWTFLTGPKPDVDAVLKGMGAYTASFADHAPMFLVGDGRTGRWSRLNGFPEVARILAEVDALAAARAVQTAALGGRP